MKSWDLRELETEGGTRSPVVLHSEDAARAVLVALEPGQELGEHQVKEHAFVVVIDGVAHVEADGRLLDAPAGTLLLFDPDERHAVSTQGGARLLLLLAPWPGEGHYRGEEKSL